MLIGVKWSLKLVSGCKADLDEALTPYRPDSLAIAEFGEFPIYAPLSFHNHMRKECRISAVRRRVRLFLGRVH
jgi:hypothetical protein